MEATLTHETFAKHANTKFQIQVGDNQTVEVDLVEVSELKLSSRQEQFALVFRGPLQAFLGQGFRPFTHEEMGQFGLFIVPIKQDEEGFYYEVVFNRFRKGHSDE